MVFQITPLDTGRLFKGSDAGKPPTGPEDFTPSLAFLVRGGRKNYLVDCGLPETSEILKKRPHSFRPPGWDLASRLSALGLAPSEISTVILTHLHWDHIGSLGFFPKASKVVQEAEIASSDEGLAHDPKLVTVRGRTEIEPGFQLLPCPGHSPGHQAALVETRSGPVILAGDAAWPGPEGLGPPRKAVDRLLAEKSFRELKSLGFPLWAGHDPAVLNRKR